MSGQLFFVFNFGELPVLNAILFPAKIGTHEAIFAADAVIKKATVRAVHTVCRPF